MTENDMWNKMASCSAASGTRYHLVPQQTRRHFFQQAGFGLGALALNGLLDEKLFASAIAPKAKRVIFLFMAGAPSQLDLFDYKPKLQQHDGQPIPEEFIKG